MDANHLTDDGHLTFASFAGNLFYRMTRLVDRFLPANNANGRESPDECRADDIRVLFASFAGNLFYRMTRLVDRFFARE